jgi:NDP-sugar pyrophosphorylase family protein
MSLSPLRSALLLTAGLGNRLVPLTAVRAKPAVPVAGNPIVRRISRWLAREGVVDLVLNLHHLPSTITSVMGDGSDLGVRIRYSWEQPVVLGSAGGPRQALPILGSRTFLLVNGDTLTDPDLQALTAAHLSQGALVTLALTPNQEPLRYGGVLLDTRSSVTGFVPRGSAATGSFHFLGVQVAEAEAFRSIPDGQPRSSIGGLYDDLIASRPGSVAGFVCDARFWDVGTVSDYWKTSWTFIDREAEGLGWLGRGSQVHSRARVTRSILWDDVSVTAGCELEECIVTDGVHVPEGASYDRSILSMNRDGALAVTRFEVD